MVPGKRYTMRETLPTHPFGIQLREGPPRRGIVMTPQSQHPMRRFIHDLRPARGRRRGGSGGSSDRHIVWSLSSLKLVLGIRYPNQTQKVELTGGSGGTQCYYILHLSAHTSTPPHMLGTIPRAPRVSSLQAEPYRTFSLGSLFTLLQGLTRRGYPAEPI